MSGVQREGHDVSAVEPALGGGLRGGGELAVAQAVELGRVVEHDGEVVGVGEEVLLERRGQRGETLVEVGELLLLRVIEAGSGQRHLAVPALDEVPALGIQVEAVESVVHGRDARVQRRVELDRVAVRRHQRGELLLDGLHLRGAVGGRDGVERPRDAVEQRAAALQRDEGVLERRGFGLRGDRVDLGALRGERLVERGEVVLDPDAAVRRQIVGEGRRSEEGIGHGIRHRSSVVTARSIGGGGGRSEGCQRPTDTPAGPMPSAPHRDERLRRTRPRRRSARPPRRMRPARRSRRCRARRPGAPRGT